MAEPLLSVRGLAAGYGPLRVVDGVDLDVRRGDLLAIMGPNGAGKSTLLKALFGMATEQAGTVHLDGRPLHGRRPASAWPPASPTYRRAGAISR